ncbi:MAG: AsmA family protein, partial [Rhodoferax sp.]|nr:AsmA family protein [Rhodoferax sp.]
ALERTGRVLAIRGDLTMHWGWPSPRLRAAGLEFANPPWAKEPRMLVAESVDISIDLLQLLRRALVFPEVVLGNASLYLEQSADGRKSWLLDLGQRDEKARIRVDRLRINDGTLGYDDALQKTSILASLSTAPRADADNAADGRVFKARGSFRGLPLQAQGRGGPVLSIRDESKPYALDIDATFGHTRVRANGSITGLLQPSAVDMQMGLSGDNLAELYVLLGIVLPSSGDYVTGGHLVRSANRWQYENFTGRIGRSDLAGSIVVETGGQRPLLTASLTSTVLDMADLGPLIGMRVGAVEAATKTAPTPASKTRAKLARVLPDLPFNTERWKSLDAEVTLQAKSIHRSDGLPLERLDTHLSLRNALLTLDPLDLRVAQGHLRGTISLDGNQRPTRAHARIAANKLQIGQIFPGVALGKNSIGELNGKLDLAGSGASVGSMLGVASGQVGLVVTGGEISQLLMEKAGLHLWEILQLNLAGDRLIKLRCAVADFEVRGGTMQVDALVFDTAVTTILGRGSVDLATETLDLTLNQRTKNTSFVSLRSPIHVTGSLASPVVEVDKAQVAVRALGAIALGVVNPFLALIPLLDSGPGKDSDCGQLVKQARVLPGAPASLRKAASK